MPRARRPMGKRGRRIRSHVRRVQRRRLLAHVRRLQFILGVHVATAETYRRAITRAVHREAPRLVPMRRGGPARRVVRRRGPREEARALARVHSRARSYLDCNHSRGDDERGRRRAVAQGLRDVHDQPRRRRRQAGVRRGRLDPACLGHRRQTGRRGCRRRSMQRGGHECRYVSRRKLYGRRYG